MNSEQAITYILMIMGTKAARVESSLKKRIQLLSGSPQQRDRHIWLGFTLDAHLGLEPEPGVASDLQSLGLWNTTNQIMQKKECYLPLR